MCFKLSVLITGWKGQACNHIISNLSGNKLIEHKINLVFQGEPVTISCPYDLQLRTVCMNFVRRDSIVSEL